MLKTLPSKVETTQKVVDLLTLAFSASQIQLNDETCRRKRQQVYVLSIRSELVRAIAQVVHCLQTLFERKDIGGLSRAATSP